MDELGQILDGIDVVVRRRADELNTGGSVAGRGDPGVHFVPRQVAALARLGPLCHFDLNLLRIVQIVDCHPKPSGCHLLDGTAAGIAAFIGDEPFLRLAALTGVALATQAVHGDGHALMGLLADGPVTHGPGLEPADDGLDWLDSVERKRLVALSDTQQAAQVLDLFRPIVDAGRKALEQAVIPRAAGLLEIIDVLRIEKVVLPIPPPFVVAARIQRFIRRG